MSQCFNSPFVNVLWFMNVENQIIPELGTGVGIRNEMT